MNAELLSPGKEVNGIVTGHFCFDHTFNTPEISPYIPRGCAILGFCLHFGEPQVGYLLRQESRYFDEGRLYLFGQCTEVFFTGFHKRYSIIATFLNPCYTGYFLRDRGNLIINDIIDITEGSAKILIERLREMNNRKDQVKLIEAFISEKVRTHSVHPVLNQSISLIANAAGHIREETLIEECNTSKRTLQRLFGDHVGISPKEFSSIVRFRKMITKVMRDPKYTWLDAVTDFNYYDQSHLTKTFHKFTGGSPQEYFAWNHLIDSQFLKAF